MRKGPLCCNELDVLNGSALSVAGEEFVVETCAHYADEGDGKHDPNAESEDAEN